MNKYLVLLAFFSGTMWGALPAQADVNKVDFNLSTNSVEKVGNVDNMNQLIFLKARVGELEKENDSLKKKLSACKGPSSFGAAYINEDGQLKCKSEDGGADWDWNGKTWFRPSFGNVTSSVPFNGTTNCPTCPRR